MKRFWKKFKIYAKVFFDGLVEGRVRRAEWHRKNHSYFD